jgi:hypothetical protein
MSPQQQADIASLAIVERLITLASCHMSASLDGLALPVLIRGLALLRLDRAALLARLAQAA